LELIIAIAMPDSMYAKLVSGAKSMEIRLWFDRFRSKKILLLKYAARPECTLSN